MAQELDDDDDIFDLSIITATSTAILSIYCDPLVGLRTLYVYRNRGEELVQDLL